jgi:hypothetical protein
LGGAAADFHGFFWSVRRSNYDLGQQHVIRRLRMGARLRRDCVPWLRRKWNRLHELHAPLRLHGNRFADVFDARAEQSSSARIGIAGTRRVLPAQDHCLSLKKLFTSSASTEGKRQSRRICLHDATRRHSFDTRSAEQVSNWSSRSQIAKVFLNERRRLDRTGFMSR